MSVALGGIVGVSVALGGIVGVSVALGGIVGVSVALREVDTVVVVGDGVDVEDSVVAPGVGVWACAVPRGAMNTIIATAVSRGASPRNVETSL